MNLDLAKLYGTPGAEEEQTKVAEAELFTKLAAEQGIDLTKLSDEQVVELYNATFSKTASAETPAAPAAAADDEQAKLAAAQAEFAKTQEWKEKCAEMDYLGRLMAHAFVQETGKIKEAADKLALSKTAAKDESKDDKKSDDKDEKKDEGKKGGFPFAAFKKGGDDKGKDKEASAPAAKTLKKQASAIDDLAINLAFTKAAEAGFDQDEARARLTAVHTLGLGESEKIASATNVDGAVEIRSLEYLEAAGYPVEWNNG